MYLTPFMPPIWLENILEGYYIFFEKADLFIVLFLILLTVFGLPIFILLGGAAYVLFAGRITSYNVCYTKLLRAVAGINVSPAVLIARNVTMAFVATPFSGFNLLRIFYELKES